MGERKFNIGDKVIRINKEFYNKHKMAQLIKFNKGLSEYRYDNLDPIAISQEINDNINNRNIRLSNFFCTVHNNDSYICLI